LNLLLDTQIVVWSLNEPERLSKTAQEALISPSNQIWVSAISIWEMVIKTQIGKLRMPENVIRGIEKQRFGLLSFTAEHGLQVTNLPLHHSDPFDRALLAQAATEDLKLVTADDGLGKYAGVVKLLSV
jgi:PIN domain nuclease of toxin-antitoxin system